mgnify:CR=1 FL=1
MSLHKNSSGRGIHQPGQYQVANASGSTIVKGTVVQITGLSGFMTVTPVDNPSVNNILGVVVDDIADGESGYVARMGLFGQFDTTAFSVNDQLYSDGSGNLTTTALGPKIGLVLEVSATDGKIHMYVHTTAAVGGADGYNTLNTTLTGTDVSNGFILLPTSPSIPSATVVSIRGGVTQVYGEDYTVSGNTLTFISTSAGDLGNLISSGDILTILYK